MRFPVKLDRQSEQTLHEQLYDGIRRAILSGALPPGHRLPSSRELADLLEISRSTVTDCYEQLLTEGYFEARAGSGTFVTRQIQKTRPAERNAAGSSRGPRLTAHLSSYGKALSAPLSMENGKPEPDICFFGWRPAFDEVPITQWTRVQGRRSRRIDPALLDFTQDPLGYKPLREAVTRYISRSRGVKCNPEQVLIVLGLQQAIDLVSRVHIEQGDAVAVENPGYPLARKSFALAGGRIIPVPVDEAGLAVDQLSRSAARNIRLVYVTPSHQFPTGALMPLPRRLALLSWAKKSGAMILEDDYDSEYRYSGKSIPALQGLDEGSSVIYVGTFTKVMFPALSIAYMVVPTGLADIYARARTLASDQVPLPLQDSLAEFIDGGYLERHVKRMRSLYDQRRTALVVSLEKHFGERVLIRGDNAGLHLLGQFQTQLSDAEIAGRAAKAGIGIVSTADYYCGRPAAGEFLLGYGNLTPDQIEDGIKRLARALGK